MSCDQVGERIVSQRRQEQQSTVGITIAKAQSGSRMSVDMRNATRDFHGPISHECEMMTCVNSTDERAD